MVVVFYIHFLPLACKLFIFLVYSWNIVFLLLSFILIFLFAQQTIVLLDSKPPNLLDSLAQKFVFIE